MPAEWQARQLLLAASAPGPRNMRSPLGKSTFTDLRTSLSAACPPSGARAAVAMRALISVRGTMFGSHHDHRRLLDDVAHEPRRIPIRRVGLGLAAAVRAPSHQHPGSLCRRRKLDLPLPEAVLAF